MREKLTYFILGITVVVCMGLVPTNKGKNFDYNMDILFDRAQDRQFTVATDTPTVSQMLEREIIVVETGDMKLFMRYKNKRRFIKWVDFD